MPNRSRFLTDIPLAGPGEYTLNPRESHHAVNVLRLGVGDGIIVFDGKGHYGDGIIDGGDKTGLHVSVDSIYTEDHLPLMLTVATAMPKGKRWQILVEKCTELGADRIIPLLTERSVVKGEGDPEKWRRWTVEAAKQSRRSLVPEVTEPVRFKDVVAQAKVRNVCLFYADPEGDWPFAYRDGLRNTLELTVLIGPEGGFSEAETTMLRERGAKPLRLSLYILRIETAAAAVCAMIREAL